MSVSISTASSASAPPPWWARLSAYSDVWTRYLDWAVRRTPHFWEGPLLLGYATGFFLAAGRQRRAIMENMAVLRPREGWWRRLGRAYGVFWEFSWMILDSARTRAGERHVTWRLDGAKAFAELLEDGAAVLLTAHMGNYDVAAPYFAHRLGRRLNGVRASERRPELQAYLEKQRRAQESENFRVRYNEPGGFLAVELTQALQAGEIVALQGDRVVPGISPLEVVWRGQRWPLPAGPFALALAAGAPVFPLFIRREGWRRYRIIVREPFRPPKMSSLPRAQRAAVREQLITWWASQLAGVLEASPSHWLMFEKAFAGPVGEDGASRLMIEPMSLVLRDEVAPRTPPVPQRRSSTPLGRWIDRALDRDWHDDELEVPAEAPAQNPIETLLLTLCSLALTGAGAWFFLLRPAFSAVMAAVLWPLTIFALFHVILLACAGLAEVVLRRGMAAAAVEPGLSLTRVRLTEQFLLATLTGLAGVLLFTPAAWLGALWLVLAVANTILFFLGKITDVLPESSVAPERQEG